MGRHISTFQATFSLSVLQEHAAEVLTNVTFRSISFANLKRVARRFVLASFYLSYLDQFTMPAHNSTPIGIRQLMTDVIDYAGLFPPARLELQRAAADFARYQNSEQGWMLGRFVIPASLLPDLDAVPELFAGPHAPRLSVIARKSEPGRNPVGNFKQDMGVIAEFSDRHAGRAVVDSIEWPWPMDIMKPDRIESVAEEVDEVVSHVLGPNVTTFVECSWRNEHSELLKRLASSLSVRNGVRRAFGLKIRTGGLTPDLVPEADDVARFIATAHRASIPFKATAGLHHAARNFDENVGATMFGFLNIFVGAILLKAGAIDLQGLGDVLTEESGEAFVFDQGIAWRDTHIGESSVMEGRRFAVSFGSCSFDDPLGDLQSLDLL
jgi:hypothetical protein